MSASAPGMQIDATQNLWDLLADKRIPGRNTRFTANRSLTCFIGTGRIYGFWRASLSSPIAGGTALRHGAACCACCS
jgi:hypothetical protein